MTCELANDLIRVLILDVSGLYSQIYDEMWVDKIELNQVKHTYGNVNTYKIIEI